VMTGPDNAGAVWAAQRLRDDHVTVVANGFTIRLVCSLSLVSFFSSISSPLNCDTYDPLNILEVSTFPIPIISSLLTTSFRRPRNKGGGSMPRRLQQMQGPALTTQQQHHSLTLPQHMRNRSTTLRVFPWSSCKFTE
jgi:hypothetical protein